MGMNSKIEWTTHTFNPWWGCTKVSDGCRFCYAEALSIRYGHWVWGPGAQRRLMSDHHWKEPLKWDAQASRQGLRSRVFCASMADVFDEEAPAGQLSRLWGLIRQTTSLDWQLLTKRPHRIAQSLPSDWGDGYANVWLGTTVEDERVVGRISHLIAVPAVVHFLSLEPLIGPLNDLPLCDIEWVIVGGESGPHSRPMEKSWVLEIRRQCREAGVAFFFKQWGGPNKKRTGRVLNGRCYSELPSVCHRSVASTDWAEPESHGSCSAPIGKLSL
jgi:protein gp37